MAPSAAAPRGMRAFLVIWIGQVISIIGSGLTSFGLAVWIFQRTGEATPFALTALFGNLPRILLSPVAGAVADRWSRRWVMILADAGNALVTVAALLLITAGGLEVWHIYLIALAGSVCGAFQEPAYTASITMLVPKQDLTRANGLVQMSQALEMLAAPLLAGALFGLVGLRGLILIDFITFFAAIGALLLTPIPQPAATERPASGSGLRRLLGDAAFGFRYLSSRGGLFGLLLYFALVNFLLNFAGILTGPLTLSFSTPTALGLIQAVAGVGMLAGSIALSAWGGPKRRIQAVLGFISLMAIGLVAIGLIPSPWLVGAGFFCMLFCVPLASGASQAIFQTKVPADAQGRVFAIRTMLSRSMMPLAFLISGPLADRVFEPALQPGGALSGSWLSAWFGPEPGRGIGLMFVLAGVLLAIVSALAAANPRIRNVEAELPDALPDAPPATAPAAVAAEGAPA